MTAGVQLSLPICALPGCRALVAAPDDVCPTCRAAFGDYLAPVERDSATTADEVAARYAARDDVVRAVYAARRTLVAVGDVYESPGQPVATWPGCEAGRKVRVTGLYGDGDTAEYETLAGDKSRALIASRELARHWRRVTDSAPAATAEPETRRNQRCWICDERHTCTRTPQGWECPTCQTIT